MYYMIERCILVHDIGLTKYKKKIGSDVLRCPEQGQSGPGPSLTPRARASSPWPWPLISGASPPIFGLAPWTFRVGLGWPQGQSPLSLPVDSLPPAKLGSSRSI